MTTAIPASKNSLPGRGIALSMSKSPFSRSAPVLQSDPQPYSPRAVITSAHQPQRRVSAITSSNAAYKFERGNAGR